MVIEVTSYIAEARILQNSFVTNSLMEGDQREHHENDDQVISEPEEQSQERKKEMPIGIRSIRNYILI